MILSDAQINRFISKHLYLLPFQYEKVSKDSLIKFKKPPAKKAYEPVTKSDSWQKIPQNLQTLSKVFISPYSQGLAIATGLKSDNLEVIDIDTKNDSQGLCKAYVDSIQKKDKGLYNRLVIQKTISGGYHLIYRYNGVEGNQKLYKNLIETRGEGGYICAHPSQEYEIIQGSFDNIPTLNTKERNTLFELAKDLSKLDKQPLKKAPSKKSCRPVSNGVKSDFDEWKVKDSLDYFNVQWLDGYRNDEIFKVSQELNRAGVEMGTAVYLLEKNGINFDGGNKEHLERLEKVYRDKKNEFGINRSIKLDFYNKLHNPQLQEPILKPSKRLKPSSSQIVNELALKFGSSQIKVVTNQDFKGYLPQSGIIDALTYAKEGQKVLVVAPAGAGKTETTLMCVYCDTDGTVYIKLCPFRIQPEQVSESIAEPKPHRPALHDKIMAVVDNNHDDARHNINNLQDTSYNAFVCSYDRNTAFVKSLAYAVEKRIIKKLILIIDESHLLTQAYSYRSRAIDYIQCLKKYAHGVINLTATPSPYCIESVDKIINYNRITETKRTYQNIYTPTTQSFGNPIAKRAFFIQSIVEIAKRSRSEEGNNLTQVYCESVSTIQMVEGQLLSEGFKQSEIAIITGDKEKVTTPVKNYLANQSLLNEDVKVLLHTSTCVQAININNPYDKVYCLCPVLNDSDYIPSNFIQAANRTRKSKHIHLVRFAPDDLKLRPKSNYMQKYRDAVGAYRLKAKIQMGYYTQTQTEEQKRIQKHVNNLGLKRRTFKQVIDAISRKPKLLLTYDPLTKVPMVNEILIEHIAERQSGCVISEDEVKQILQTSEFVYWHIPTLIKKIDVTILKAALTDREWNIRQSHASDVKNNLTAVLNRVANVHSDRKTRNAAKELLGEQYEKQSGYVVENQIVNRIKCEQDTQAFELHKRGIEITDAYRIVQELPHKDAKYFPYLKKSIDIVQRQELQKRLKEGNYLHATYEAIQSSFEGVQRFKVAQLEERIINIIESEIRDVLSPKIERHVKRLCSLDYSFEEITKATNLTMEELVSKYSHCKEVDKSKESKPFRINRDVKRATESINKLLLEPIAIPRNVNIFKKIFIAVSNTDIPRQYDDLGVFSNQTNIEYLHSIIETLLYTAFYIKDELQQTKEGKTRHTKRTVLGRVTSESISEMYKVDYDVKGCENYVIIRIKEYLEKITALYPDDETHPVYEDIEIAKETDRQNQLFYTLRAYKQQGNNIESTTEYKELLKIYPKEAIESAL